MALRHEEFLGLPPTGRQGTIRAMDCNRLAGGKFVEHWGEVDLLGLLQHRGAVPTLEQASA